MAERARNPIGRMAALCAVAVLAAACGRVEEAELALEPYEDRGSFGALELALAPDREHRVVVSGIPPGARRLDIVFDLTALKGSVLALVTGAEGREAPVRAVAVPGRPVMVRMRPGKGPVRVTLVGTGAEELPVRLVAGALLRLPDEEAAGDGAAGAPPETSVAKGAEKADGDGVAEPEADRGR